VPPDLSSVACAFVPPDLSSVACAFVPPDLSSVAPSRVAFPLLFNTSRLPSNQSKINSLAVLSFILFMASALIGCPFFIQVPILEPWIMR
jgi:hypothetical protein